MNRRPNSYETNRMNNFAIAKERSIRNNNRVSAFRQRNSCCGSNCRPKSGNNTIILCISSDTNTIKKDWS